MPLPFEALNALTPRPSLVARWVDIWESLSTVRRNSTTPPHWAEDELHERRWEQDEDGDWLADGDWVWIEGEECAIAVEASTSCDECPRVIRSENAIPATRRNRSGRASSLMICRCCYEEAYFICDTCGDCYHGDLLESSDGGQYCQDCTPEEEEENGLPAWHDVSRPPMPNTHSAAHLWLSAELEMEAENPEYIAADCKKTFSSVICERDGSLCHKKGIEVILPWRPSFSNLSSDLCQAASIGRSYNATSWGLGDSKCGCHISINGGALTGFERAKIAYLVFNLRDILVKISGRDCERWASFALSTQQRAATVRSFGKKQTTEKFRAVRLDGSRIEFRMFRGTLNPHRLELYVKTVEEIVFRARCSYSRPKYLLHDCKDILENLHAEFIQLTANIKATRNA